MYRFEKENSSLKTWLDRCESLCCPDTELLSADKIKIRNELQNIQVLPWLWNILKQIKKINLVIFLCNMYS